MCQIEHQDHDIEEAVLQVQHHREENWERYNDWNQLRDTPLEEGFLVLLYNTKWETSYTNKLVFWWLSPFQICEIRDNGSYLLKELDGTRFSTSVQGSCLKPFYTAYQVDEDSTEMIREIIDNSMDILEVDNSFPAEENEPKHAGPETHKKALDTIDPDIEDTEEEEEDLQDLIPQGHNLAVIVPQSGTDWLCCTGVIGVDFIVFTFKDLLLYILWLLCLQCLFLLWLLVSSILVFLYQFNGCVPWWAW